jgi:small-conductance mechanosensitive channel
MARATLEESEIASQGRAQRAKEQGRLHAQKPGGAQTSAAELLTQIAGIRRTLLESEVTLRTDSILNPWFWVAAIRSTRRPATADRIHQQAGNTLHSVWQPGKRLLTCVLVIFAVVLWGLGRRLAERGLTWLCIHRMPEGRLRRSALALASVVATVLTAGIALRVLFLPSPANCR